MQHAVLAMFVQQSHTYFEADGDGRWSHHIFSFLGRVGIEDCFATDTTCSGRRQVQQKRPRRLCLDGGFSWNHDVVGVIICSRELLML